MGPLVKIPPDSEAALDQLSKADPILFLRPSPDISQTARAATKGLAELSSALAASAFNKGNASLVELHADGFDAEQIWLQLDLSTSPMLGLLRKRVHKVLKQLNGEDAGEKFCKANIEAERDELTDLGPKTAEEDSAEGGVERGSKVGYRGHEKKSKSTQSNENTGKNDPSSKDKKSDKPRRKALSFEDDFLNVEDMEKFLEKAEANGGDLESTPSLYGPNAPLPNDDDNNDEDDEGDESDELDGFDNDDDDDELGKDVRYDDFFGDAPSVTAGKGKDGPQDGSSEEEGDEDGELEAGEEDEEEEEEEEGADADGLKGTQLQLLDNDEEGKEHPSQMSAYEKRSARLQERVHQLEDANLNNDSWILKGEVTAAKRPKNSALEVDIEFEHAARPAPVITEAVTASLEDLICQRITNGQYNDVERKAPAVPADTPSRDRFQLDETPSQKGLGDIYEAEYMTSTGMAPAAAASSETLKQMAGALFKELSLKLDALSHYHFAPKPVVEDMAVRADVPALAMEEVAPVMMSEASLLAPEEIFAGGAGAGGATGTAAGAVKAPAELSQSERRSRHSKAKRKRHAELKAKEVAMAKRTRAGAAAPVELIVNHLQPGNRKGVQSEFTKSAKVFGKLQDARDQQDTSGGKAAPQKQGPKLPYTSFKL
eukprot:jgi/Mesen1/1932/ME000146S01016